QLRTFGKQRFRIETRPDSVRGRSTRQTPPALSTLNTLGAKASEQGPGLAGRKPGIAARIRTVSASHSVSRWHRRFVPLAPSAELVFQNLKNDVWRDMPVASIPEETAIRHRYNAHKRQWVHDTVRVKIEPTPFNRGAMRECFRLKKLSGVQQVRELAQPGLQLPCTLRTPRLQMNAKLWAQEYNRHNPPKKVDIMQMYVIEFKDREGAPLYHLEHHIEGEYIKHNSNSGFVDENARRTPHALSHFTFERSGHQLIVVDIQGAKSTAMVIWASAAWRFSSRPTLCNDICRRLRLSRFDLAPSECVESPSPMQTNNATCVRGDVFAVGSPMSPPSILDSGCSNRGRRRLRFVTGGYGSSGGAGPQEELAALSAALKRRERPSCVPGNLLRCGCDSGRHRRRRHVRPWPRAVFIQSRSEDDSSQSTRAAAATSTSRCRRMPRGPPCNGPIPPAAFTTRWPGCARRRVGWLPWKPTIATKNDIVDDDDKLEAMIDWPAALFHERLAAQLGVVEAAVNLARLHLGLPPTAAPAAALRAQRSEGHSGWMEAAAKLGDRSAMLYLARAHDTGDTEGPSCADWDSGPWQQRPDRPRSGYDSLDTPAELYLRGGYGWTPTRPLAARSYGEAAEEAMAEGNGKLAAKYYALAEEAAALVPDDEEAVEDVNDFGVLRCLEQIVLTMPPPPHNSGARRLTTYSAATTTPTGIRLLMDQFEPETAQQLEQAFQMASMELGNFSKNAGCCSFATRPSSTGSAITLHFYGIFLYSFIVDTVGGAAAMTPRSLVELVRCPRSRRAVHVVCRPFQASTWCSQRSGPACWPPPAPGPTACCSTCPATLRPVHHAVVRVLPIAAIVFLNIRLISTLKAARREGLEMRPCAAAQQQPCPLLSARTASSAMQERNHAWPESPAAHDAGVPPAEVASTEGQHRSITLTIVVICFRVHSSARRHGHGAHTFWPAIIAAQTMASCRPCVYTVYTLKFRILYCCDAAARKFRYIPAPLFGQVVAPLRRKRCCLPKLGEAWRGTSSGTAGEAAGRPLCAPTQTRLRCCRRRSAAARAPLLPPLLLHRRPSARWCASGWRSGAALRASLTPTSSPDRRWRMRRGGDAEPAGRPARRLGGGQRLRRYAGGERAQRGQQRCSRLRAQASAADSRRRLRLADSGRAACC
uniref:Alpha-type protein kinase domain-containing protein n=1 Tax=Macrostomum lignano TaxID=282301 RepID=A0A1I8FNV9_9PLAT